MAGLSLPKGTPLGYYKLQNYLFAKPMTARALPLWVMNDCSTSNVFRNSLFGAIRRALRQGAS